MSVQTKKQQQLMLTDKQKDVLYRLKQFAEVDLEAAERALADDASDYDIRIALFLAKTIGIE